VYLIDTDTMVCALNGEPLVVQRFKERAQEPKAISVISYGELLFGAMRSARMQENLAKVRRIRELFPVLDVSQAVMETFASLKAELLSRGRPVSEFDLVIASTAITLNCALVTNNERHFRPVPGLRTENWSRKDPGQ